METKDYDQELEAAHTALNDPGPAPAFLAPVLAPEQAPEPEHTDERRWQDRPEAPMPDVDETHDTPAVLVVRAYEALRAAGDDLTNLEQMNAIREQEEVLAAAADELQKLRVSLDKNDPGEFIIAVANDVRIPIPATALMMPKQSEVQRHMQTLEFHCTEFLEEWQRRRETLKRAADALDKASMLTGAAGGKAMEVADARIDDGVRELAARLGFRSSPDERREADKLLAQAR
jgi:hypothetical protein